MGIGELFNALIVGPSTELLKYLYGVFGSYGIAIIVFAVIVKVVTFPLMLQQLRSSRAMQELQPKLKELEKKYKRDRERLSQEQMKLYKEAGVNPLGGCLPLLIQLPILWGLYRALLNLSQTPEFQQPFLWLEDLSQPEGVPYILIIIMVISQWVYQRMTTPPTTDPQQKSMNQMMQFMPLFFAFLFINFPAGLVLYWVVQNLAGIVLQFFVTGTQGFPLRPVFGQSQAGSGKAKPDKEARPAVQTTPAKEVKPARRTRASRKGKRDGRKKRRS